GSTMSTSNVRGSQLPVYIDEEVVRALMARRPQGRREEIHAVALESRLKRQPRLRVVTKRVIDAFIAIVGGLVILPLLIAIAAAVRFSSPGPIFYAHTRIGRNGRKFKAWKFRTMVQNADQILQDYLKANPALRHEWERNHKLQKDPRV